MKAEKTVENKQMYDFDLINKEEIVDIIFKEITGSNDRTHIEYDEFVRIMWTTNIDTICYIHLNN